ncbi:molybdopterin-dependent oxidoreductase [Halobaculum sp. MBLA0147]|uniref:molybdopterin-dependent oxidoreductase n=1 Tax=Halobaculum sp. MBLA0147 TaxID=3079934 RepID=UPI003525A08D
MLRDTLPSLPAGLRPSDILLAAVAGLAGLTGSFAVAGVTPGFVAAPIANTMAVILPGEIITFAILVLGDLGQQLNVLSAAGLAAAGLAGLALLADQIGAELDVPGAGAVVGGVLGTLASVGLVGVGLPSLATGAGVAAVLLGGDLGGRAADTTDATDTGRRRVLGGLPGLVGVGAAATVAARSGGGGSTEPAEPDALAGGRDANGGGGSAATKTHTPTETTRTPAPGTGAAGTAAGGAGGGESGDADAGSDAGESAETATPTATPTPTSEITRLLNEADRKTLDVDGIEPLVSQKHYVVDTAGVDPDLSANEWSLSLTGQVDETVTFSYEDLTSMAVDHRFVTLRCVGEGRNGKKMDTALWTGVPVDDVLAEVDPDGDCDCVMLRSTDGFYEEIELDEIRGGLLAYGMNGEVLPRRHGYPVRILVPGHWGEVNVKWIDEIEFMNTEKPGYWEKRNWQGTGPVNTVAKLKTVNRPGDGRIQVGGHAYAGTRGISRVEVSTDGGDSWTDARLSEQLPGDDVWRQWEYTYDSPGVEHEVVIRATDQNGNLQTKERTGPFPSGATGWVSKTVAP